MQATHSAHHPKVSFEPLSDRKTTDVFKPILSTRSQLLNAQAVARRALGLCFPKIGKYNRSKKQWHKLG